MARIIDHLPVEELEARYRAARDATEARHTQAIWLLAQGRTFVEVAEVLAFVPRCVEELAACYNALGARARPRHLQRRCPAAEGGMVGHLQRQAEQADDGTDQPLGLPVGGTEHGPQ